MLKRNSLKSFFFLLVLILLSCSAPNTPQQVTQAFWQSVLENKSDGIVKYSTLTDSKQYDHFSKNWQNYQLSFGKVVIDGEDASVECKFSSTSEPGRDRVFATHLVRRDEKWVVDYAKTNEDIQGGPIGSLLGQITQAGKALSKQLGEEASHLDIKLKQMGEELEALTKSLESKAKPSVDKLAAELRKNLKALEQSIQRALKDKDRNWSEHDRNELTEISADLQKDNDSLANPSVSAIAASSKNVGEIQQRLNSIDEHISGEHKKRWVELSQEFEKKIQDIIDELAEDD